MNADSSRFEVEASLGRQSPSGEVPSPQATVRTADSGMERSHDPLSRLSSPFQLEKECPDSEPCFDASAVAGFSSVRAASNNEPECVRHLPSQVEPADPPPSLLASISASPVAIRSLKGSSMSFELLPVSSVPASAIPSRPETRADEPESPELGSSNATYGERFPTPFPARTSFGVAFLWKGAQVQIDATAFRSATSGR